MEELSGSNDVHRVEDLLGSGGESETHTRRQELRERVETDHASTFREYLGLELKVARYAVLRQEIVWVVLKDEEAVLLSELEDVQSSLDRVRASRWVASCRVEVKHAWSASWSRPVGESFLKLFRADSSVINVDLFRQE